MSERSVYTHRVTFRKQYRRPAGDWDDVDDDLLFESEQQAKFWIDKMSKGPQFLSTVYSEFKLEKLLVPHVVENSDDW